MYIVAFKRSTISYGSSNPTLKRQGLSKVVYDNNLQWLPQRPVYNYHHCEFRFWRNNLKAIPYSLWYHMFRNQQTRSFGIGKPQSKPFNQRVCRLTIKNENGSQEIDVQCPPQYQNILVNSSPPTLQELSKRKLYKIICDAAKKHDTESPSIYSDSPYGSKRISHLQDDFKDFNIDNAKHIPSGDKNGNYEFKLTPSVLRNEYKVKDRSYYAVSDIVEEHYNFLPQFMKKELRDGPLSRCENVACSKPIFDFVLYEFCQGEIMLIDRTEHVILSAVFCSKSCAEIWKSGKTDIIHWSLVQND